MRHLADQPTHGVTRQSRVRIERHDIAHAWRGSRRSETHVHESGVGRGAQQPVQFVELAPLAFPPDPARFAFIPNPAPMQKKETGSARSRAIAQVEPRDAFCCRDDERRVACDPFGRGVGPVRHQREMQIALGARKVMDLKPLDQRFHAFQRREQRRHRDEGAQMRGNAVAQLQGGQKSRGKAEIDRAIDQCDRGVDGGNGAERGEHAENGQVHALCGEREQRRCKKDCGDSRDRRQIAAEAGGSVEPRRPASHGQAVGDRLFESAAPAREQDVSSVSPPRLLRCRGLSLGLLCRKHAPRWRYRAPCGSSRAKDLRSRCGKAYASENPCSRSRCRRQGQRRRG